MTGPPTRALVSGSDDARRALVESHDEWQGIDYLEVVTTPDADNQFVLELHWLPKTSAGGGNSLRALLDRLAADPAPILVRGGERVRDPRVASATRTGDVLRVRVTQRGDFSTYTLSINPDQIDTSGIPVATPRPRLDPAFSEVDFSFKAGCPSRFDCRPRECPPTERAPVAVDYMAKDYASFRQALLDLLPSIAPEWSERHEADLGITLVELLAYLGDQISYQQDAVANEAYLESARQRVSVRRHARLVDYLMHDGVSARTFVHVRVTAAVTLARRSQLLTRVTVPLGDREPPHDTVLQPPLNPNAPPPEDSRAEPFRETARMATTIFETEAPASFDPDLNDLPIYTWTESDTCVPRGATWIDLDKDVAAKLRPGSMLLLEETAGADTGLAADADVTHRQVVRIVESRQLTDPVVPRTLTRVRWHPDDALTFPLCVTQTVGGVQRVMAIARGNLVLASHGETRTQFHPEHPGWTSWNPPAPPSAPPRGIDPGPRAYRFHLDEGPLTRVGPSGGLIPVTAMQDADPATVSPEIELLGGTSASTSRLWSVSPRGLLVGDPFSRAFAVETETDGRALLRFGDDVSARAPDPGSFFWATYRIGVGRAGNVGADAIVHYLTFANEPRPAIQSIRNPIPAWGGLDPERLDRVRERAPEAFRATTMRAVTEADYAEVAERHVGVSHARARFRWTGSWHTVFLTIDPVGQADLDPSFAEEVRRFVEPFAQAGYDLDVRAPQYAPLGIVVHVCAAGDRFRPDIEAAAREALRELLAPDRLTFGQRLYLSELYAALEAVDGVDSAVLRRFSRAHDDDPPPARPVTAANVDRGFIPVGIDEILRVDDDPSRPERGWLEVTTGGGR